MMKNVETFSNETDKVILKFDIICTHINLYVAALKCRQRKKQWLHNLQERVEFLANDNEQLQIQASLLRDEVLNLRALLMTHKNCPLNNNSNKISMSLLLQQQPQLQQSLNTQPLLHQQQPKEVQYTKMK